MITLIAKLKAKPGQEALLAAEAVKLAKSVQQNEKGCLMYIPHVSVDNPAEVTFVEKYADQEAFDVHGRSDYFKSFSRACKELLDERIQIQFLKELD